jgi:hypothetical protein
MPRDIELIHPQFFYPKSGPVVKGVLVVKKSQQHELVKQGVIPPPVEAYEGSRTKGYFGSTLLEIQEKRRARAEAKAAAAAAAAAKAEPAEPAPARKRKAATNQEVTI